MGKTYVRLDEHGRYRVGDTRVLLDLIVSSFYEGDSPECIRSQYGTLTLEDVYGAITHYLAHKEEIDAYLKVQQEAAEKLRAEIEARPNPVMERLLRIKQERAQAEAKS